MFMWDECEGFVIYLNGFNVGGDLKGKIIKFERSYFMMFIFGRLNNVYVFLKVVYDELVVWERKFYFREIEVIY